MRHKGMVTMTTESALGKKRSKDSHGWSKGQ
jgi:hypothetical protein